MGEVIYEAKAFYGVSPAFAVMCAITVMLCALLLVFWKRVDAGVRWFVSFLILFFSFLVICQVVTALDVKSNVFDKYIAGDYSTAQGPIIEYIPSEEGQPELPDYFCVDGVEFQVPGFVSVWGYPLKRCDGGELKNGMNVRIYYVAYKHENVILKIELVE